MKKFFEDIQNYIEFLRQSGYYVSLSGFNNRFYPYTEKLLQLEIHLHTVCNYLKSNPKTAGMCVCNKAKLYACKIKNPIYSCCYAGVEEYIFPVYYNKERIICIHISGYRDNIKRSKRLMEKISPLCSHLFRDFYTLLSPNKPTFETVESFIKPLEYMIISLYNECDKINQIQAPPTIADQIYLSALQYINDNYMNNISAEVIAKELQYSVSYLRAVFKKKSGVSIQSKINDIRLENARFLLLNTPMNITDISYNCGFLDSNYFSVIFKKKYCMSPLLYKKIQYNTPFSRLKTPNSKTAG